LGIKNKLEFKEAFADKRSDDERKRFGKVAEK